MREIVKLRDMVEFGYVLKVCKMENLENLRACVNLRALGRLEKTEKIHPQEGCPGDRRFPETRIETRPDNLELRPDNLYGLGKIEQINRKWA